MRRAASKTKSIRRGVKEVVKALRKNEKGYGLCGVHCVSARGGSLQTARFFCSLFFARSLCIIAGNISPIDVITHIPILCEEAGVPYVFVPSKEDLGASVHRLLIEL